jgi:malic enzyme
LRIIGNCWLLSNCRCVTEQLQQVADAMSAAETERDQLAAEKEQLLPQLEQARWQSRQLEKKLEEATASKSMAEQVRAVCASRPWFAAQTPQQL